MKKLLKVSLVLVALLIAATALSGLRTPQQFIMFSEDAEIRLCPLENPRNWMPGEKVELLFLKKEQKRTKESLRQKGPQMRWMLYFGIRKVEPEE